MTAALTVVVPVWDSYCAKLAACVEDVLAQGPGVEILVVDNASELPLPELPDGVRTLRLPARRSIGAARNAALPELHTRYVLFADADDRLLPGTLAFLVSTLERDQRLIAAACRQVFWDPVTDARSLLERTPRPIVYRLARFRRLLALCTLRFNIFPIVGCAVLRADAVRESGGFGDGNVGEDWELCAALAWRGPIGFSRRPGRLYAVQQGSLWHRSHERAAFEEHYARFRERLFNDPALPRWARLARRAVTRLHARDLERMFRDGPYRPEGAASGARAAAPSG